MFDGNRVTAHTRSRYPIFQSPMTWIARAPLVTAVSAAGGMGLLENSIRDLSVTTREFTAIRAATNQPFGVNLPIRYLQMDPKEEKAIIDWLLGQGIHFVTTSAGDPTRYTKLLKDAGVTVYHATATLRGAIKAVEEAGVDGLIVEGAESAGIRNPEEVHTFALLQAVRERVDVPLVAAGGIVDGRGMAAAFALGAEGVTMGTRFVASFESPVHINYKNAIVAAPVTGTIMTDNPPRARSRGLRTPYSVEVSEGKRERLARGSLIDALYVNGDVDNTSGAAGESAGLIHEIKSVREIIDHTIAGFWREIDRLAALRPRQ
jgi:enoyl-[acyl-carrier protein] reductase II